MTFLQACKDRNVKVKKEGAGYTVPGSLDLSRCTGLTSLPELTVGGSLDLSGCTGLTSLPELTVGGSLDLSGCTGLKNINELKSKMNYSLPNILSWKNGKYILVDGILSEVISKHGNSWKTHRVGKKDTEYIISDGEGRYSHGATIKEARDSLFYKLKDRDTSEYKKMTPDTVLSFADAIQCYRAITGACEAGTRGFIETHGKQKKYTIAEMVQITKGAWGSDTFSKFFDGRH